MCGLTDAEVNTKAGMYRVAQFVNGVLGALSSKGKTKKG